MERVQLDSSDESRARMRKLAIWARVTAPSGQYRNGSNQQPRAMPAAYSASLK